MRKRKNDRVAKKLARRLAIGIITGILSLMGLQVKPLYESGGWSAVTSMVSENLESVVSDATVAFDLPDISGITDFIGALASHHTVQLSDGQSRSIVQADPSQIPDYSGVDYVELNGNVPCFSEEDTTRPNGETFSNLDYLNRCGPAFGMLHRSMMPTTTRESIGMVRPSGWHTVKYPGVIQDLYLYNRCHLIAFALTGQNANEKNLITGTRYMNTEAMLPFEKQVMRYLDKSENHVLYRVTPYFKGTELVARGVEMEAYSVEDNGAGVSYHVFVYNQQPGIVINYQNGDSYAKE